VSVADVAARPLVSRRPRVCTWTVVVGAAAAVYAVVLSLESIYQHVTFRTGFDTAIYDQYLWLLAHGHEAFSTVLNRPMLGDHFQPGLALLTPLYSLDVGVPGLLVIQSVALALAAPALYALARHWGAKPPLAAVPAILWLVSPATALANQFEFHLTVFVPALLVLGVLAAERRQHVLLLGTAALAMSFKEDIPLTYVMLGVLIAVRGQRRLGMILATASATWFVVAHQVLAARGGSFDAFGERFAGDRGDSINEALLWVATHPLAAAGDIASQSLVWLLILFLTTGGLALLGPQWMILSLPTLSYNMLSAYDEQHDLLHHYHLLTAAGFFVAAAYGARHVETLKLKAWGGRVMTVGIGCAAAIAITLGVVAHGRIYDLGSDGRATRDALSRIPPGAAVAATPHLQPHLSQRVELYTLPEPFIQIAPGNAITGKELAERANNVEFVAYLERDQTNEFRGDIRVVLPMLREAGFREILRRGPVHIYQRLTNQPSHATWTPSGAPSA
jgi:uncharacterized membrane protein